MMKSEEEKTKTEELHIKPCTLLQRSCNRYGN